MILPILSANARDFAQFISLQHRLLVQISSATILIVEAAFQASLALVRIAICYPSPPSGPGLTDRAPFFRAGWLCAISTVIGAEISPSDQNGCADV